MTTSSILTLWVPIGVIILGVIVAIVTYVRGERRIKRQRAILDQRISEQWRTKGGPR